MKRNTIIFLSIAAAIVAAVVIYYLVKRSRRNAVALPALAPAIALPVEGQDQGWDEVIARSSGVIPAPVPTKTSNLKIAGTKGGLSFYDQPAQTTGTGGGSMVQTSQPSGGDFSSVPMG